MHSRPYRAPRLVEWEVLEVRTMHTGAPGSSVGIATDYGLDGPG